jgi:hypothetical protein
MMTITMISAAWKAAAETGGGVKTGLHASV